MLRGSAALKQRSGLRAVGWREALLSWVVCPWSELFRRRASVGMWGSVFVAFAIHAS